LLLTKTDLLEPKLIREKIKEIRKINKNALAVSVHDWESLENFKKALKLALE